MKSLLVNYIINLTNGVTGVLPVANGGTNSSSVLTNDKVIVSVAGKIQEGSGITYDNTNKSLSAGDTCTATGLNSGSFGEFCDSIEEGAFAFGGNNISSGFFSTSIGFNNRSTNDNCFASGVQTEANGSNSSSFGDKGHANAINSVVFGFDCDANGTNSIASGNTSDAKGTNSVALGQGTISNFNQLAIGRNNVEQGSPNIHADTDEVFIIGNGASIGARSTVLKVLKNGNFSTEGTIKGRTEIVQVTALTKSLILTDANTEQEMSNALAQTLTIEPDVTTNFPIGTRISVFNFGVGVVTIVEGAGVTIVRANSLVMNGQGASIELVKRSANTWSAVGGLV